MGLVYAGKANERVKLNRGRLYTLVATLLLPNGELRLRSDVQKPPYWKYVREAYFAMTPYHMKGGVTASNVKWHWLRSLSTFRKVTAADPITVEERDEFVQARAAFNKKLRKIWRILREMIVG